MLNVSDARALSDQSRVERKIREAASRGVYRTVIGVNNAATGTYWQSQLVAQGFSATVYTQGIFTTTTIVVDWNY